MIEIVQQWLNAQGLHPTFSFYTVKVLEFCGVILLCLLSNLIARRHLLKWLQFIIKKTKSTWDDVLFKRKAFNRLSHFAPALVLYFSASISFPLPQATIENIAIAYMIAIGLLVTDSFLNAFIDIYSTFEISKGKPIKGYVQGLKIFLFIVGIIFIISTLMERPPWGFLSGIGAMTAVLLLVFKDSLLGLIAGFQLASYDMVRIGDWIEMPKFRTDGEVIDISLNTVKVQNWDKTITTIPTYALISDSFKNWRGMEDSEGRRIKRVLFIDLNSVQFCTEEMLNRFEKFRLITDYIQSKRRELKEESESRNVDPSESINLRQLTNIGTFRAYIEAYLRSHRKINQEMTFLLRHLQPTEHGLPIEIYVFCNDKRWAHYESIQADIFDHLLAVAPEFNLRLFQNPTGRDFQSFAQRQSDK